MTRFNRSARTPLAVAGLLSCAILAGCGSGHMTTGARDDSLIRSDDLVMQGRKTREEGLARDDSALIARGDAMIADGKRLKEETLKRMAAEQDARPLDDH